MFKIGHYGLFLGHNKQMSQISNAFTQKKAGSLRQEKLVLGPRESILGKPDIKYKSLETVGVI